MNIVEKMLHRLVWAEHFQGEKKRMDPSLQNVELHFHRKLNKFPDALPCKSASSLVFIKQKFFLSPTSTVETSVLFSCLTLSDSTVREHAEQQDPPRGAHSHQARSPERYSTSQSTFTHGRHGVVTDIHAQNSLVHGVCVPVCGGIWETPTLLLQRKDQLMGVQKQPRCGCKNKNKIKNRQNFKKKCLQPPHTVPVISKRRLKLRAEVGISAGSLYSCQRLCCLTALLSSRPRTPFTQRTREWVRERNATALWLPCETPKFLLPLSVGRVPVPSVLFQSFTVIWERQMDIKYFVWSVALPDLCVKGKDYLTLPLQMLLKWYLHPIKKKAI